MTRQQNPRVPGRAGGSGNRGQAPRSLAECLGEPSGALADLARRAAAAGDLGDWLREGLDPRLAARLHGAALRPDGTLVVLAESPAWATRLRFLAPTLLERCRERHPDASRVRVRVDTATGIRR